MKISLYVGDICEAPADVICTSTNQLLDLMSGTGRAVCERGGWEIQDELKGVIRRTFNETGRRSVELGSVVMTTPGALPQRGIIHCAAVQEWSTPRTEHVVECVQQALTLVQSEGHKSVAIPILATGSRGLDYLESLSAIIDALQTGDWPRVERVWIAAHDSTRARAIYPLIEKRLGRVEIRAQVGRPSAEEVAKLAFTEGIGKLPSGDAVARLSSSEAVRKIG